MVKAFKLILNKYLPLFARKPPLSYDRIHVFRKQSQILKNLSKC